MENVKSRILFVSRGMGIGGAQKALVFVANTCAEAGYDVTIVSLSDTEPNLKIDSRIKVEFIGYNSDTVNKSSAYKRMYSKLNLLLKLRKCINDARPNLVVTFMADIVRIVTLSMRGIDVPIIGSERANPLGYSKKQFNKYAQSYDRCTKLVFQTNKAASVFDKDILSKSVVIPNPSIPRLNPIEAHKGQRKKVIAAAGRLHSQKRFDILISAFSKVIEQHPDYQLHIYGEGEEREVLQNKITELNIEDKVFLKGEHKDVFSQVNDNSMFVLSSDYEGIPNVLIEALSIGMPCISTDCDPGGPRQLLDEGRRGLLVPVGDINALTDAICTYINDSELARTLGEKGKEVNSELAPEVIGEKWLKVIKSAL
ncbi:glycosyltransferase family 4 protein [Priestia endophytica]|uniref:glycosyltransferase family 4 protein n=1 Tax=Priestia endophytica TaxID=135735 RepID=UPI0020407D59|nr:glycosyltransferase family 4 protein [Priestia endophytica]MCM3539121.1 glycosyltransferase family 4 protein [Priestia endophytica]